MMHRVNLAYTALACLGLALIVADDVPSAAADTNDVWPYEHAQLPGFPDASTITDAHTESVALGTLTTENVNYVSDIEGAPLYSAAVSNFDSSLLELHNSHVVVTGILDDSAAYPSIGTVADRTDAFLVPPEVAQNVPLITNFFIDDPDLGVADEFYFAFGSITNVYLSDAAGTQDVLTLFGQSVTLFDFPAADAPAGAASELSQLLDEFATLL